MSNRIEKLLREVKQEEKLGAFKASKLALSREKFVSALERESGVTKTAGLFDWLQAPFHGSEMGTLLRPAMATVSVVVIAIGWVSTVVASYGAVPGDTLYRLKLAAERAQLSLTHDQEDVARLRIEFANRRAEEVTRLMEAPSENRTERVRVATDALKEEMKGVQEQLSNLSASNNETAKNLAKLVDRKVAAITETMNSSLESGQSEEVQSVVKDARDAIQIAGTQALSVLVTGNEQVADSLDKKVAARFEAVRLELQALSTRLEAATGSIEKRIGSSLVLTDADRALVADAKSIKKLIQESNKKLEEVRIALDHKSYSEALAKLQEVSGLNKNIKIKIGSLEARIKDAAKPIEKEIVPVKEEIKPEVVPTQAN